MSNVEILNELETITSDLHNLKNVVLINEHFTGWHHVIVHEFAEHNNNLIYGLKTLVLVSLGVSVDHEHGPQFMRKVGELCNDTIKRLEWHQEHDVVAEHEAVEIYRSISAFENLQILEWACDITAANPVLKVEMMVKGLKKLKELTIQRERTKMFADVIPCLKNCPSLEKIILINPACVLKKPTSTFIDIEFFDEFCDETIDRPGVEILWMEDGKLVGEMSKEKGIIWQNKCMHSTDCEVNLSKIKLMDLANVEIVKNGTSTAAAAAAPQRIHILDKIYDYLDMYRVTGCNGYTGPTSILIVFALNLLLKT